MPEGAGIANQKNIRPDFAHFDFGQAELDEERLAQRYRTSQLDSIFNLVKLNMAGNLISATLTMIVLWPTQSHELLAGWFCCLLILIIPPVFVQQRRAALTGRHSPSIKSVQRCVQHAVALSVCWSVPSVFFFPFATPDQQVFMAAIVVGMMCAGGFSLYTIRKAAWLFTGIMAMAAAAGLIMSQIEIMHWLLLLLVIYSLILLNIINSSCQVFRNNVLANFDMERQKDVIELLLTDFQQSTTDVLWQVDEQLTLQNPGPELASRLGKTKAELTGMPFVEAIRSIQQNLPEDLIHSASLGLYEVERLFSEGKAFQKVELPVRLGYQESWWTVTAKPQEDGHWVGCISDLTVQYEANRNAWKLGHEDAVTELSNRRAFHESVELTLRHLDDGDSHGVLCLDLDRFKSVNDAFGHDSGDHLLKIVAKRLSKHARTTDIVARTGGDEFNVLLRHVDRERAQSIAESMLHSLQQPCQIGSNNILVGASIGLAMVPDDGIDLDTVRKNSDLALYEAKKSGRGRVVTFDPSMAEMASRRMELEQALRYALATDELSLVFQPQRSTESNAIVAAEALTRWHSHELGKVDTQTFINIAEDTGQIHALGSWVLLQSCRLLAEQPELPRLAVNVSPLQLANPAFVGHVKQTVKRHRIAPQRLELEITETALLDDNHGAAEKLTELKQFGVRIALDDFGIGYSSLRYLQFFPFDKIKIDRSFIKELTASPTSSAIVEAVISMAHAMDMEVVAEGVECLATLERLKIIGCDTVQGYAIAMPQNRSSLMDALGETGTTAAVSS